jgi:hypothetical protein
LTLFDSITLLHNVIISLDFSFAGAILAAMQTPSQLISQRLNILAELAADLVETSPRTKARTELELFAEEMDSISREVLQLQPRELRVARLPAPRDRYLTVEAQKPTGEWESVLSNLVCEDMDGANDAIRAIRAGEIGTRF